MEDAERNTAETPTDAKTFLEFLKQECDFAGVKYLFPETEKVSYPEYEDMMVAGYFADKPEPTLACAVGKPVDQWFEILIHESCHMDQWVEQTEIWDDQYLNGIDCDKRMDQWLAGKEFTEEEYTYFIRIMQAVEIDCERRSVDKINQFNLPVNITSYIKKANSYLFFYSVMLHTHKWCDTAPYNVPEIVAMMPESFLEEDEQYYEVSDELLTLYKEKCYNSAN
jgi:hypothetical protein